MIRKWTELEYFTFICSSRFCWAFMNARGSESASIISGEKVVFLGGEIMLLGGEIRFLGGEMCCF